MALNERNIDLKSGGSFATLKDFLDRRIVKRLPFVDTQELVVANAQFKLIDSSVLSGSMAVGVSSVTSGGVMVAALAGAVGTAATTKIVDSFGNILNKVDIRNTTTHDAITYDDGGNLRVVFGLLQCSSGVADGSAIGAAASENLQISFVYATATGVLTLCNVNETIEFQVNKMLIQRSVPTIEMEAGSALPDVLDKNSEPTIRHFVVTTAFAANEVITLSSGNGASAGRSTPTLDSITLANSDALFTNTRSTQIWRNGVRQNKGSGKEVVWDSTTTLHFTGILDVGDEFEVQMQNN